MDGTRITDRSCVHHQVRCMELWYPALGNVHFRREADLSRLHEKWKTVDFAFVRVYAKRETVKKANSYYDGGFAFDEDGLDF